MKDANQAAEQVADVTKRHPEVTEMFGDFKFRGQEQKKTAVAEACSRDSIYNKKRAYY